MKPYLLTTEEAATLNAEERRVYDRAAMLVEREWANGPLGGWADGHDLLKSIGWTQTERRDGHRVFVALSKPARFLPPTNQVSENEKVAQ